MLTLSPVDFIRLHTENGTDHLRDRLRHTFYVLGDFQKKFVETIITSYTDTSVKPNVITLHTSKGENVRVFVEPNTTLYSDEQRTIMNDELSDELFACASFIHDIELLTNKPAMLHLSADGSYTLQPNLTDANYQRIGKPFLSAYKTYMDDIQKEIIDAKNIAFLSNLVIDLTLYEVKLANEYAIAVVKQYAEEFGSDETTIKVKTDNGALNITVKPSEFIDDIFAATFSPDLIPDEGEDEVAENSTYIRECLYDVLDPVKHALIEQNVTILYKNNNTTISHKTLNVNGGRPS